MSWRALTRYVCDLCGTVTEVHTSKRLPDNWASLTVMLIGDDDDPGAEDLCPECVTKLRAWLAEQRKTNDRQ